EKQVIDFKCQYEVDCYSIDWTEGKPVFVGYKGGKQVVRRTLNAVETNPYPNLVLNVVDTIMHRDPGVGVDEWLAVFINDVRNVLSKRVM
ncbi:MAG: hypothetical protein ABIH76_04635, partial [Candidatus Bathyarchaeota archaeon]